MAALSPHAALIYVMVTVSAADGQMSDAELEAIAARVKGLPVFHNFDRAKLLATAQECGAILQEGDGLEAIFGLVSEALPAHLTETAYALALDVALSDREVRLEELRVLERLRHALGLDKLVAAALERAARAWHQTI